MSDLAAKTCVPCRGGVPPMKGRELKRILELVPEWKAVNEHGASSRYPAHLGQSRSHLVDAQDRRPDGERLHHGGQD